LPACFQGNAQVSPAEHSYSGNHNEVFDKIADAERHDVLSEPENFAEAQRRAA